MMLPIARRTLGVLVRNLPACLFFTLLVLAPVIAWALVATYPAAGLKGGAANGAIIRFVVTTGLAATLLSGALAGALTPAALATLGGRSLSFPRAIADGVRGLTAALGATALVVIAIVLGAAALLLPGLVLLGLLYVAVPAAVAERAISVDAALVRGAALARPRWPWLLALALAPGGVAGAATLGLARLIVPHVAAGRVRVPAPEHWGRFVVLTLALALLAAMFSAVAAAVGYAALRGDGPPSTSA